MTTAKPKQISQKPLSNQPETMEGEILEPASSGLPEFDEIDTSLYGSEVEVTTDEPKPDLDENGKPIPRLMTPEEFYVFFRSFFKIGAGIPKKFPPFPLMSMPIQPDEEEAARECSDTLYEICLETPWLQALVKPQSKWALRLMAIGYFGMIKIQVIREEISSRVPKPIEGENNVREETVSTAKPTPEDQTIDLPDFLSRNA